MRIESKRDKSVLKKAQIISALEDVRRKILAEAAAFSGEQQDRAFIGTWSVKDLLAHLAGWDHANIKAASEVMTGEMPSFYAHHDHDWQTYNAMLVSKYRHDSLEESIALAESTHRQLIEFMRAIPAEVFGKDFGVRFHEYRVTIERLLEAEAKDEADHLEQIIEFKRTA